MATGKKDLALGLDINLDKNDELGKTILKLERIQRLLRNVVDPGEKARLQKMFVDLETQLNNAGYAFSKMEAAQKRAKQSAEVLTDGFDSVKNSSALAGANVIAISQIFSDMPYGIRGVANNVTQLSQLFVTLAMTAGGLKNAIKGIWGAMMGPLGILMAIQAVTAAIQAWDMRQAASKRATKELKEAKDSLGESIAKESFELQILFGKLQATTQGTVARKKAIDEINKSYHTNLKNLKDEAKFNQQVAEAMQDAEKALRNKIALMILEEKAIPMIKSQLEARTALNELEKQSLYLQKEAKDLALGDVDPSAGGAFQGDLANAKLAEKVQSNRTANKLKEIDEVNVKIKEGATAELKLREQISNLIKTTLGSLESISALEDPDKDKSGGKAAKAEKEVDFIKQKLDLLDKVQEAIEDADSREIRNIQKKYDSLIDDLKTYGTEYIQQINDLEEAKYQAIKDAEAKQNKAVKEARDAVREYLTEDEFQAKREAMSVLNTDEENELQALADKYEKIREVKGINHEEDVLLEEKFQEEIDEIKAKYAKIEHERKVQVQQMSFNVTADALSSLAYLFESFDDKDEARAKRNFETAKKIRMAETVISTIASAQKSYESLASILYVGPILGAIAAAAAITAGVARFNQIKNTKFESKSPPSDSPGGRGSTPDVKSLAGKSGFSQVVPVVPGSTNPDGTPKVKVFVTQGDIRDAMDDADARKRRVTLVK